MKKLTCNQAILLLDIYRGYNKDRHTATLKDDLRILTKEDLIYRTTDYKEVGVFEYQLTTRGGSVCQIMLMCVANTL